MSQNPLDTMIQNLECFYENLSDKFEKPISKDRPISAKAIILE